ncbi:MAG: hypothetical protein QOI31_2455 [Solirubrobacterales bacterium]|jgi:hypothetical protein|nr:hypothetical protein [Solirubrobacterales bacterium]
MFVRWNKEKVEEVFEARERGLSHAEISELTGVSIRCMRTWFYRRIPTYQGRRKECPPFQRESIPRDSYAYLLGAYLGDGFLTRQTDRTMCLRIVSDSAYPGILDEFAAAMEAVSGGTAWRRKKTNMNAWEIGLTWWHWTLAFPQHGPGRKHKRKIELEPWQWDIVKEHTGLFLRGLIHSDGWRGWNKVKSKGKWYAYPRYQFSNRSDDIRKLFCDACDLLGVEWKPWTRWHISVARRDSVALLDEHVGFKY